MKSSKQFAAALLATATVILSATAASAQIMSASSPLPHQVVQRDRHDRAQLPIVGTYTSAANRIEARAVPMPGFGGTATDWQVIADPYAGGSFSGTLHLAIGWYQVQVRAMNGSTLVTQKSISEVGVGDVYVTAGQSNAANNGSTRIIPTDPRISATDMVSWRFASDPQPYAQGGSGSPWPAMADALVDLYDVPVGMLSVGYTSTTVAQWQPGGTYYPRLRDAVQYLGPKGFKAVLWHQGESDAYGPTSFAAYVERLQDVIAQSRIDAGFDVPWGIAIASYGPGLAQSRVDTIANAQLAVIANDPLVFLGANTNELVGAYRASDGIHMSELGLREHGLRWAQAIDAYEFRYGLELTYQRADLGGGLRGWTFEIFNDDGTLGTYTLALGFQGTGGATIQQVKSNAQQVSKEGWKEWDSEFEEWNGEGAVLCDEVNPAYDMARDTWAFNPFGDNAVPGTNPITGSPLTGIYNAANAFAMSSYSGTGSTLGDGVNVAYVVASGKVSWTGTIFRNGHTFAVSGVTELPAILGDFNADGSVTHADYTVWADHYGHTIASVQADHAGWFPAGSYPDGSTSVTHGLYTTWADHFGDTNSDSLTVGQSSVPAVADDAAAETASDRDLIPASQRARRIAARKQLRLDRAALRQQRRLMRAAGN